jgi:hypothetical protein
VILDIPSCGSQFDLGQTAVRTILERNWSGPYAANEMGSGSAPAFWVRSARSDAVGRGS